MIVKKEGFLKKENKSVVNKLPLNVQSVALVGLLTAMLSGAKMALAAIPNVEIVTLLCALFGFVFGWCGVLSSVIFCAIEAVLWGFGTWVISYFLYWPFLCLVFSLLGVRRHRPGRVFPTVLAVLLTVWFGVLTSLIEVGLLSGAFDRFFYRFGIYYARGIAFYVTQILTNAVLFPLVFPHLASMLSLLRDKTFRKRKSPPRNVKELSQK